MTPQYQKLKEYITQGINSREWPPGHKVPSENNLAREFAVSRMTANRALNELTAEGVLERIQGLGTFVAEPKPSLSILEIRNIADDIRARGHAYSSEIITLEECAADPGLAARLDVAPGTSLFHSKIIHCENNIPVQLEERYVNPQIAPDYLSQDYTSSTPNEYLCRVAPLQRLSHDIEAVLPDDEQMHILRIKLPEACLLLHRRSWSGKGLVSYARLTHPGSRYRLSSQIQIKNL